MLQRKFSIRNPKNVAAAFDALRGIVTSKNLRLGRYREVVKVKVAKRVRDPHSNRWTKGPEEIVERESAPVCWVADIPIAHLIPCWPLRKDCDRVP